MRKVLISVLLTALSSAGLAATAQAATTDRIEGTDRYLTAVEVSRSAWTPENTQVIYLARGDVLVDALTAGTLRNGPILLTRTAGLPPAVDAEITRLGNKPIVVLGDTPSVSDATAQAASRGEPYTRLAGTTREGTSVAISKHGFTSSGTVYVTDSRGPDGQGSPDAVAGGALHDGPILLVDGRRGPTQEVQQEIERLGATNIIQLGDRPLRMPVTSKIAGNDRYATSVGIANRAFPNPKTVYLARGDVFADAASLGSLTDGPVVLTRTTQLPPATCQWLSTKRPDRIVAAGSDKSVSNTTLAAAKKCAEQTPQPVYTPQQIQAAQQLTKDFTVPTKATSLNQLGSLRVANDGSMAGYSRDLFRHWLDASAWGWPVAPSNACDVRNAALYRDGVGVTINSNCTVQSGRWLDPYTAVWLNNKSDVDIDHMVPLAEAWRTGASNWSDNQRRQFANDRLVVVSADDGANQSKGDKGPDAWKPANQASWCLYGKRYTAVKAKYGMTTSTTEKAALQQMIGTCST